MQTEAAKPPKLQYRSACQSMLYAHISSGIGTACALLVCQRNGMSSLDDEVIVDAAVLEVMDDG